MIFRPKREEVAGSWRRLHNEELHKLDSSPDIVVVVVVIIIIIKSRKMGGAGM